MLTREKMTVQTDANNIPFVHMPSHQLWEFVECMALHRHSVVYSFRGDGFTVQFSRLSFEQAQTMVDGFTHQGTPTLVAV